MKERILYILLLPLILSITSSCGSTQSSARLYDPKEVTYLSEKLGIHLSNKDKDDDKNMPLYAEVSLWLGTPYRYGGMSRHGTDCSGFTMQVFRKVYKKKTPRSTSGLGKANYPKIAKRNLQTGDIILFATGKKKKEVTHAGIYLKNGIFIHASTSKGVMTNHIEEDYYKKRWIRAVRVK